MKRVVFGMLNPSRAGWPTPSDLTVAKVCGFGAQAYGVDEFDVVDGGAVFSDDQRYRYRLWRVLSAAPMGTFCRVDVVNMLPFVSTDPEGLYACPDPDGEQYGLVNRQHIEEACRGADLLIAAWGGLSTKRAPWLASRSRDLLFIMRSHGDVFCLGKTQGGDPLHPSRLPYAAQLKPYRFQTSGL